MLRLKRAQYHPDNKVFMSVPNASIKAGQSLRQFCRSYEGRIFPIGRCNFVLVSELDKWMEMRKEWSNAPPDGF